MRRADEAASFGESSSHELHTVPVIAARLHGDHAKTRAGIPHSSQDRALQIREADAGDDFTMQVPDEIGDVNLRTLAQTCIAENERRLAAYDPRLLRPNTVPWLVKTALRLAPGGR
jgi:hypothetical protein